MLSTIVESPPSLTDNQQVSSQTNNENTPPPPSAERFKPRLLAPKLDAFQDLGEIGRGQFGSVHKVQCKKTKQILVWKKLDYQRMAEKEKKQLQQEVQLLQTLDHDNVVRYLGKINKKDSAHIYLLMEYCDGGDLGHYLDHTVRKGYPLPEDTILLWFSQLVDALHYCHTLPSGKVYHRDIKPQNVLICDEYKRVKLGDFGLAKMLQPQQLMAQTHVGTPYYMSPEVLNRNQYDAKSDVWSLGCLLYEMATGRSPHCQATTLENLKTMVAKGGLERLPSLYSKELYSLIVWMLAKNPLQRPSTADLRSTFAFRLGCFVSLAEVTNKIISRKKETDRACKHLNAELSHTKEKLSTAEERIAQLEAQVQRLSLPAPRSAVVTGGDRSRPSSPTNSLRSLTELPDDCVRRNSQPPRKTWSVTDRQSVPPFAQPVRKAWAPSPSLLIDRPHLSRFPSSNSPFSTPLRQAKKLADRVAATKRPPR